MTDAAPTSHGTAEVLEAPPEVRPRRRRAKAPLSEGARAERRLGWLLCAPAVIVMVAVTAYPIGYAVYLSLQRYDLRFPAAKEFVGLANYATVLTDNLWWTAFAITMVITVVSVVIELVLGMGLRPAAVRQRAADPAVAGHRHHHPRRDLEDDAVHGPAAARRPVAGA